MSAPAFLWTPPRQCSPHTYYKVHELATGWDLQIEDIKLQLQQLVLLFHNREEQTIVQFLNISLHLLHTFIYVVKRSESDVSLYLSPGGQLVNGSLGALDLRWLHSGGSSKLVLLLTLVLKEREQERALADSTASCKYWIRLWESHTVMDLWWQLGSSLKVTQSFKYYVRVHTDTPTHTHAHTT